MLNKIMRFGSINLIMLFYWVLRTKLLYGFDVRIIRSSPFVIGKRNIRWGRGFTAGRNLRIECFSNSDEIILQIGKNVKLGDGCHLAVVESVYIDDNVLIGSNVLVTDHNHGAYNGDDQSPPTIPPDQRPLHSSSVVIGKNVWIGDGVVILPGAKIEQGVVVGANSIVTGNLSKNSIYAGAPAKCIKAYNIDNNKWEKIR